WEGSPLCSSLQPSSSSCSWPPLISSLQHHTILLPSIPTSQCSTISRCLQASEDRDENLLRLLYFTRLIIMRRFAGFVLVAVVVVLGMASALCISATMDHGVPGVGRKLLEATPQQPLIHASLRDQPGPPSPTHNVGKVQSVPPPPPMQPPPSA
ncbi:unnamed protein product, partial [Musa textilis]